MNIHLIRNEKDYEDILHEIERLFEANVQPGTPEGDSLEIFIMLVEKYENEHYPIPLPDPVEAIKYYMESRNLTRRDLEPFIGNRARVADILNRKRHLSLHMIQNLEKGLGIPAKILIQPYELIGSEGENRSFLVDWLNDYRIINNEYLIGNKNYLTSGEASTEDFLAKLPFEDKYKYGHTFRPC